MPPDSQQNVNRRSDRTWGWIFSIIGVFITMWGFAWLCWGIYGYFDPPVNFTPSKMLLLAILFGQSGLLLGFLIFVYGTRRIRSAWGTDMTSTENKDVDGRKNRTWGWICSVFGGLFTLWGILFMVLAIINAFIIPGSTDSMADAQLSVQCYLPGLLIGIPLLLIGSRMIISEVSTNYPLQKTNN
ncbi:MAG: hypothetical protein FIA98_08990 [Anaerolineae bacterium]|nr:hypothetical protein [Anaerolineae bacterium]